jgi:hypothetical protein
MEVIVEATIGYIMLKTTALALDDREVGDRSITWRRGR